GVFCRGFRRWNDHEFHRRWKGIFGSSTHLSRAQIERLADLWQLAEQCRLGARVTCDAQAAAPGACSGWKEFANEDLDRFCEEFRPAVERSKVDADASGPKLEGVRPSRT